MEISKRSSVTGEVNTRDLDITREQFERWLHGESIQDVFTNISETDKEFLSTGIIEEDWPCDPELGLED